MESPSLDAVIDGLRDPPAAAASTIGDVAASAVSSAAALG